MKATEAKKLTSEANTKHTVLALLYKQIEQSAKEGNSWTSYKNTNINPYVLEVIIEQLEKDGYEINMKTDSYIQIEW